MPKRLTFLPALAFTAFLALPVAAEPTADTVVARVNGQEITLGHVISARSVLPQQYQQIPPEVLYTAILDQLIQQTTLQQTLGGKKSKQTVLQLENEERSLAAAEVLKEILADAASDEDIKAAYDAKYSDGFDGDEFRASHILVETEEEAKAIKAEIEGGADFAETAKEKSTGPSGPGGGDLGWFGLGAMVPEFESAVVALEPGELSDPVKTQFGWHIIKLDEKRKKAAPEFDSVRDELANQLQQEAIEAKIEELTAAAKIERPEIEGFSPEMIMDMDLIGD